MASAEARVRAHAIFHGSGNTASDETIARQLEREGLGSFTRQCVGVWRRRGRWVEVAPRARQIAQLGDELREAIQVRVPDDLDRVEQASLKISAMSDQMAALGESLAEHIVAKLRALPVETAADLETAVDCLDTVARSTSDVLKAQLVVGKALQDLRLLRVSSAFSGDGPREGEVIPPDRKRERETEDPMTAMEAVISNFSH